MYQQNPVLLEIATKTLLKKRKLYSPAEWERIITRLQSVGKKNGGLHSADEYGRRMIKGQKERIKKIAKRNGREVIVYQNPWDPANGSTRIAHISDTTKHIEPDIIDYGSNPIQLDQQIKHLHSELIPNWDTGKLDNSRRIIKKNLRDYRKSSVPLSQGEILSHEADEYSLGLANAKKYGLKNPYSGRNHLLEPGVQSLKSTHHAGVLDREAKRKHLLTTLYGRDSFVSYPRDAEQFAKNKKKFVFSHPITQKHIATNSTNPSIASKANLAYQHAVENQKISELTSKLKSFGYDTKRMSIDDVQKEYLKVIDRKYFKTQLEKQSKRRGIQKYIKDPDYDPSETETLFRRNRFAKFLRDASTDTPEGYIINPEYRKFKEKYRQLIDTKISALGEYLEYLESKIKV